MREAIGGTWLFQIVIVFVLLFTGFMCLSINRSKAFNVKNYILETIQSNNGNVEESIPAIVEYMKNNSYRTTGTNIGKIEQPCGKTKEYVCYNREGNTDNHNPVFCLGQVYVNDDQTYGCLDTEFKELPTMYYYHIVVFYQLDLPFFHELFGFKVPGDTKVFYNSRDV